jgi:hypothetical protein
MINITADQEKNCKKEESPPMNSGTLTRL